MTKNKKFKIFTSLFNVNTQIPRFKIQLTVDYDHKQRTFKHRNTQNYGGPKVSRQFQFIHGNFQFLKQ